MDPARNPYAPGAGSRPPALMGRDGEIEEFRVLLQRLLQGRSEQPMLIHGLRGVGKTVLLNRLEAAAIDLSFVTAFDEIKHQTDFRALMARNTHRALGEIEPTKRRGKKVLKALRVLKSFSMKIPGIFEFTINIEAAPGRGDSGILDDDLTDLFLALGEAASERKTGVVFLFDEIQLLKREALEALIAALHRVSQKALPLTCIGAGLPQILAKAIEAKSYSERLFKFPKIGGLPPEAAREALCLPAREKNVDFESAAVENIISFTEGYPYFLQEYGKQVWNKAKGPSITLSDVTASRSAVQKNLDDQFFRIRVERCTPSEIAYMQAMCKLGDGPYQSGAIASELGKESSANVGPTRAQLIEKGLIYSVAYGSNAFTVPHFADFLRRNFPRSE